MKRMVLCFDGTWNSPADDSLSEKDQVETNVRRFSESVASQGDDGVKQTAWYNAGVGTEKINKLTGGAFGALLDMHILDGYRHLFDHYEDGDEVYIVGFSRGAYTARSLVGMLRNCGLAKSQFGTAMIGVAYGIYRTRDDGVDSSTAKHFRRWVAREVPIKFVGVWDTVGALGIPLQAAAEVNAAYYRFHDTGLSSKVENAYHAIAIDEHRELYQACLWDPSESPQQTLEQRWFCGAHCDTGGGYPDRRLSDISLRWMQDKAAALGLGLTKVSVGADNYLGVATDSYSKFLLGEYKKLKARYFRPALGTKFGCERLDESVALRRNAATLNPRYAPTNAGLPTV